MGAGAGAGTSYDPSGCEGDEGHSTPAELAEWRDVRLLGAEFFEAAADLYSLVPYSDAVLKQRNRGMCLTLAACARLDAASFEDMLVDRVGKGGPFGGGGGGNLSGVSGSSGSGASGSGSPTATATITTVPPALLGAAWVSSNIDLARHAAATARAILASEGSDLLGLRFLDPEESAEEELRRLALVIEFSALCKMAPRGKGEGVGGGVGEGGERGSQDDLQSFVQSSERELLGLSAWQLKLCADIASKERYVARCRRCSLILHCTSTRPVVSNA